MRTFVSLWMLLAGACTPMWAQASAQIGGTISDATGAAVPGADIKVTQTATGAHRIVFDCGARLL